MTLGESSSNSQDGLPQVEEQIMKLKRNKSIFFVNPFPEAIVHLVQKTLFTFKIKLTITLVFRILWQPKIRPE